MGEGMAGCLLSNDVAGTKETPLVVWNRTPSKCTKLKDKYPDKNIVVKESAKDVIESCEITL